MGEWLKPADLKSVMASRSSGVRIPLPPPTLFSEPSRKINSTPTLRRRFTKARSMQHARIRKKWAKVEQLILEDHMDARKSAAEFRRWMEALEDPKPGKQRDRAEDPFQDLEVRLE